MIGLNARFFEVSSIEKGLQPKLEAFPVLHPRTMAAVPGLAVLITAVHAVVTAGRCRSLLFGELDDHRFSGEKKTGD